MNSHNLMSDVRTSVTPGASPARILLALRGWHEEIRAGAGAAQVIVRTLDHVSLTVHAGELVVVRGGVASGAASLIAALSGMRPPIPALRLGGDRVTASGVQIRRAVISSCALTALRESWSGSVPPSSAPSLRPVVYVFRVRESPHRWETDAHWRAWAVTFRASGGSILAHVPTDRWRKSPPAITTPRTPAVFESSAFDSAVTNPGAHASVREVMLDAGRIVREDRAPAGRIAYIP